MDSGDYSVPAEIRDLVHKVWLEEAAKNGIDVRGFNTNVSLQERCNWARSHGLEIGTILVRYSTDGQDSTDAQVRAGVTFAAQRKVFPPAEFVCVDEGISGRKRRRPGLSKATKILKAKLAKVLIFFKLSRLYRSPYKAVKFLQEEIVDEGLRAIAVSEDVDTGNSSSRWKLMASIIGVFDEYQLDATSDNVRSGLQDRFARGYATGAFPVGYEREEVADGSLTKQNKPRAKAKINVKVAALLVQHFEWVRDGMSVREGWRRWVASEGPCDPRSPKGYMTYKAYRRMLGNVCYTGKWAYGRKKTVFDNKRDYNRQVINAPEKVCYRHDESLRIISDELFYAVQIRLVKGTKWQGPKRKSVHHLWDLVTDCFYCSTCGERFIHASGAGNAMHCKMDLICPHKAVIKRETAVRAVCEEIGRLLERDSALIEMVLLQTKQVDAAAELRPRLEDIERKIAAKNNQISDLYDLAGRGSAEDRAARNAVISKAEDERARLREEKARITTALEGAEVQLTKEHVKEWLTKVTKLLEDGASGRLGQDVVHRTAALFRMLVGGKVLVHVDKRPGRKRHYVRGVFTASLISTALDAFKQLHGDEPVTSESQVWLRPVPKVDRLAATVHKLIDVDGLSPPEAEERLRAEGHAVRQSRLWELRKRYFEMIGEPMPKLPYNNGRPRRPK